MGEVEVEFDIVGGQSFLSTWKDFSIALFLFRLDLP